MGNETQGTYCGRGEEEMEEDFRYNGKVRGRMQNSSETNGRS